MKTITELPMDFERQMMMITTCLKLYKRLSPADLEEIKDQQVVDDDFTIRLLDKTEIPVSKKVASYFIRDLNRNDVISIEDSVDLFTSNPEDKLYKNMMFHVINCEYQELFLFFATAAISVRASDAIIRHLKTEAKGMGTNISEFQQKFICPCGERYPVEIEEQMARDYYGCCMECGRHALDWLLVSGQELFLVSTKETRKWGLFSQQIIEEESIGFTPSEFPQMDQERFKHELGADW
tara:strand:- start:46 stop:759 length:714 start_codon:yes stop_codon:yes gene_type:complete